MGQTLAHCTSLEPEGGISALDCAVCSILKAQIHLIWNGEATYPRALLPLALIGSGRGRQSTDFMWILISALFCLHFCLIKYGTVPTCTRIAAHSLAIPKRPGVVS